MENKEIIERIEAKMLQIHQDASKGLRKLNEQQTKIEKSQVEFHKGMEGTMYSSKCDEAYYRNVARFAWAYRAKHIAMLDLQSVINDLKNELDGKKRID